MRTTPTIPTTPTKEIFDAAKLLGVCSKFCGTESAEGLFDLFLTTQGVEFCQKHSFPSIDTLRTYRGEAATSRGIYIDAGRITLKNPAKVVLVGDTVAELHYDDPSKRHEVILMHDAKAHIEASGYAVVFVTTGRCEVTRVATDNAKIL